MTKTHVAINLAPDGTHADIAIRGTVGNLDATTEAVASKLSEQVRSITVHINSLGGFAHEGIGIYNVLRAHPAHVTVIVEGVAGSAASVVAMAGDEIVMYASALMMIHGVKMVDAEGNPAEGPGAASARRAFDAALLETYRARTGKTERELSKLLATDTWMTASEAVKAGFADRIEHLEDFDAHAHVQALAEAAGIPAAAITAAADTTPAAVWQRTLKGMRPMPMRY